MTLVRVSGLLALRSLLLTLLSVLDLFLTLGHAHSDHARFGPTHRSIEHAIRHVDMIRPNQVAHHQKAGAVSVNHLCARALANEKRSAAAAELSDRLL
jgi:cytochrome b